MTTPLKTLAAAALALGLAGHDAAAQVNIQIRLPGVRTPVPTQPVRLPTPLIPVRPLPTQFALMPAQQAIQPVVLPKVELPPAAIPAQPRIIAPGQTGPAPVAVLIENVMKDENTPKSAILNKVFDGGDARVVGQAAAPVDLRDEEDLPEEPRTQPTRRVTLPEWELEQDLGIR
ncbi:MAG TPA: hypothetical protein DCM05_05130 [Elusimicrobia bacterium]|nr:hypothetical protein [Elusimicrobiota bacterium]